MQYNISDFGMKRALSFLLALCVFFRHTADAFRAKPLRPWTSQIMKGSEVDDILPLVKKNTPEGSTIVIKYGGHAMENDELKRYFCEDIAALCRVNFLRSDDVYSYITPLICEDWHLPDYRARWRSANS